MDSTRDLNTRRRSIQLKHTGSLAPIHSHYSIITALRQVYLNPTPQQATSLYCFLHRFSRDYAHRRPGVSVWISSRPCVVSRSRRTTDRTALLTIVPRSSCRGGPAIAAPSTILEFLLISYYRQEVHSPNEAAWCVEVGVVAARGEGVKPRGT